MKTLLNLGETLSKGQQKEIFGGQRRLVGFSDGECTTGGSCDPYGNGSDCPDLDHYCQGTTQVWVGSPTHGQWVYTGGVCTC